MNLLTQWFDPAARFERQYAEQLLNRFRYLPCPGARIALESEWVEPRGWRAALAYNARVVVTGAPGAGKTTTLAHLAVAHARELLKDSRATVPLFFSARDLAPQTLPRLTALPRGLNLSEWLANQCPRVYFPGVFTANRALVLIDDADALPPEQLHAWLTEFKDAQIILSAQTALVGLPEFALAGFRDGDLAAFARQWDASNAGAFLATLKTSGVPRLLTANPLSLSLLARVWQNGQALPTRRAELFDLYAQRALGEAGDVAARLEEIALAIQTGHPASNDFLVKARGFMRVGKNRTAEFVHDLWQAYFVARALRQSPIATLFDYLDDPAWREALLFYAGLGDASELASELIARGDLFFAGHVLAHAGTARADLIVLVTQDMMRRAWDNADMRAFAVLSDLQSETAVDSFAARLKDQDAAVRTRAVEILGQLQLDRGIEYLLPQLRDSDADVRDHLVVALGHSRTDRVIEPLLVALRGDPRRGIGDMRLRVAAAKALGEIASDKALPALVVDLQIGEVAVRAAAAEALQRIPSPLLRQPLEGILHSGEETLLELAAAMLAVVNVRC